MSSFRNIYANPMNSPETPRVIKEVREDLKSRMSEFTLDLDEESIRGEVAKLANHQEELQKELQAVMQVVQIVQFEDEDNDDDLSMGSAGSLEGPMPSNDENGEESSESPSKDPSAPRPIMSPIRKRMSFAKAFFKLSKPETLHTLEEQKQRQKEIVKKKLAVSHPGLEDILEIQEELQQEIVQEHKDNLADKEKSEEASKLPKVDEQKESKKISLEEEKSQQMEMLAKKLKEIDPELIEAMTAQKNAQAEIVAKKEQEIKAKTPVKQDDRRGGLRKTKSTRNFWHGAMNRLEGIEWHGALTKLENMVGRTPRAQRRKTPETIEEVLDEE